MGKWWKSCVNLVLTIAVATLDFFSVNGRVSGALYVVSRIQSITSDDVPDVAWRILGSGIDFDDASNFHDVTTRYVG